MSETLPEPITPADVQVLRAGTLADLEDLIDQGLEHIRQATFAYVALAMIHARKLYGDNFEDYCYERFGISRQSGYRWVKVGKAILEGAKEIPSQRAVTGEKAQRPPGQAVPRAGHSVPIDVESSEAERQAERDDTQASEVQPAPVDTPRGISPSPDGSAAARGAQEPSLPAPKPETHAAFSLPEPVTQADHVRLVALVITVGRAKLGKCCDPAQLRLAATEMLEAARSQETVTPLFDAGRCTCKTPALSKTVSNLCTTCKRMRRVG